MAKLEIPSAALRLALAPRRKLQPAVQLSQLSRRFLPVYSRASLSRPHSRLPQCSIASLHPKERWKPGVQRCEPFSISLALRSRPEDGDKRPEPAEQSVKGKVGTMLIFFVLPHLYLFLFVFALLIFIPLSSSSRFKILGMEILSKRKGIALCLIGKASRELAIRSSVFTIMLPMLCSLGSNCCIWSWFAARAYGFIGSRLWSP